MEYREIGTTGVRVSAVALGTWAMGGNHWGPADDVQSVECIRRAVDMGITLIDTAPVYGAGHAEELVGKAIQGIRQRVVIATKCGLVIRDNNRKSLNPKDMRQELDNSLERLRTDFIDVYFCHWPDPKTPIEETVGELVAMQRAGKIRCFGLSNHGPDLIRRALAVAPVSCVQDQYSLVQRKVEQNLLPFCSEKGLNVFAYGPLGGGVLTDKYSTRPAFSAKDIRNFFYPFYNEPLWSRTRPLLDVIRGVASRMGVAAGQVAIAWVNAQQPVCTALVGARTPEQAASNAEAGSVVLSPADVTALSRASQTFGAG